MLKILTIVPARAGSKSIPRKWAATVGGETLLQRAVFSTNRRPLYVSTDSQEIARFAEDLGVNVIRRPDALATDDAPMVGVLQDAIDEMDGIGSPVDAVLCLQPVCPFRRPEDIDAAIELMERTGCDSVVSYAEVVAWHPTRMAFLVPPHADEGFLPLPVCYQNSQPRQELKPVYIRSGDVYLTRRSVIESGSMFGLNQRAIIIPKERHCNIDEEIDLAIAEAMLAGGPWTHRVCKGDRGDVFDANGVKLEKVIECNVDTGKVRCNDGDRRDVIKFYPAPLKFAPLKREAAKC